MGHFFGWEQNIRYLFLNLAQCLLSPLVCDIYLDYFMQIFQRVPDLRQEYCPQAPIFYIFWINSNVKRELLEKNFEFGKTTGKRYICISLTRWAIDLEDPFLKDECLKSYETFTSDDLVKFGDWVISFGADNLTMRIYDIFCVILPRKYLFGRILCNILFPNINSA